MAFGFLKKKKGTDHPAESPAQASTGTATAREVIIVHEGEEYTVKVKADEAILDAALEMDIDVPFSCQSGICTACRGKCVSGKVEMTEEDGLSEEEMAEGYVLPCVSHPLTDDVKIEIG